MQQKNTPSVSSSEYTEDYYLSSCGGYEEFALSQGRILTKRHKVALDLANLKPGMVVLDIGCGRGEVVFHSALLGARSWGMDYASQATKIASSSLKSVVPIDVLLRVGILQANARSLPISTSSIDCVFMLDVVEHLYPEELISTLFEVKRILRPKGQLIVHTIPSLWYYKYGYPIYRIFQGLRGNKLPRNPRERWLYHHVHVNEQDPIKLRNLLNRAGFQVRITQIPTQSYSQEKSLLTRRVMKFVSGVFPFKLIFCDDIFAKGIKP